MNQAVGISMVEKPSMRGRKKAAQRIIEQPSQRGIQMRQLVETSNQTVKIGLNRACGDITPRAGATND